MYESHTDAFYLDPDLTSDESGSSLVGWSQLFRKNVNPD